MIFDFQDYAERGEENGLIIERILILIRNILYIPIDPDAERRPDNDASIHDQVSNVISQKKTGTKLMILNI